MNILFVIHIRSSAGPTTRVFSCRAPLEPLGVE